MDLYFFYIFLVMERSIAVKKWEEDHLVGNAGCDRVMKLDGINLFKSGSGKLCMNFKNPQWKWKMETQCMEERED